MTTKTMEGLLSKSAKMDDIMGKLTAEGQGGNRQEGSQHVGHMELGAAGHNPHCRP